MLIMTFRRREGRGYDITIDGTGDYIGVTHNNLLGLLAIIERGTFEGLTFEVMERLERMTLVRIKGDFAGKVYRSTKGLE